VINTDLLYLVMALCLGAAMAVGFALGWWARGQ